jgi:AcrR family transcriptional regulator
VAKGVVSNDEDGRLLRGNRTREQLLEAAMELFATRGFHATSMKDLASAAGVSPPSIYNHFASKESVLAAALAEGLRWFHEGVVEPDDETLPPAIRLEGLVRRHVAWQAVRSPDVRAIDRLLDSVQAGDLPTTTDSELGELLRRYRQLIADLLDDLRIDCRLSLPSTPVATAAVLALCDRAPLWWPESRSDPTPSQDGCWSLVAGMLGLSSSTTHGDGTNAALSTSAG